MPLTTISKQGKTSFAIQANTLAALLHHPASERNGDKEILSIIDRIAGNPYGGYEMKEWQLDIKTVTKNIKAAGYNLHPLPMSFGDSITGTAWVNPSAFQAVITGKPFITENSTEQTVHALLDIEGYGRIQTIIAVATLDKFMAAVERVKPNLMKITPDIAHARFSHPGYTIFDTDQVESLRRHGTSGVNINMNGAILYGPAGVIDFGLNSGDPNGNDIMNVVINRMADKYRGMLKIQNLNDPEISRKLIQRARKYSNTLGLKMMNDFCEAVADQAPQLIKVPYTQAPEFVNPARIAWAYAAENRVGLNFKKSAHTNMTSDIVIDFANHDDARKALLAIQTSMSRKP